MVKLGIERFSTALLLWTQLRDSSLGTQDHGQAQQAIQPCGVPRPCYSFETDFEEIDSFGLGLCAIAPLRTLFR